MKEIIFFDVDDTLVDSRTHQVPESTIVALQELSKHYLLAVATGRSLSSMIDSGIHKIAPWVAYVCTNGQIVYDKDMKIVAKHVLDSSVVKQVLTIAHKRKEPALLAAPQWQRIGEVNAYMEEAHQFFHIEIPPHDPVIKEDVSMMLVYGPKGFDYAPYRDIEGIDLLPGQSTYCDIVKKGFEKSIGIKEVLKHFQTSSYIAFGDSNNDLGMMKHARIGIALGQGTDEVKKLATFVTKPVYEDGIAYAVKALKL